MKELGLQELLRYALSGGIGLATFFLTYPSAACSVGHMQDAKEVTLVLGSVLLGTLLYNLHRALLFPVLFRLLGLITLPSTNRKWWWFIVPWLPSEAEINVDRWRWALKQDIHNWWGEWGAQTHFLYCSAWAMLAALEIGKYVGGSPNCQVRQIFWYLFVVTLAAGIVHNFRLLYALAAEMKRI